MATEPGLDGRLVWLVCAPALFLLSAAVVSVRGFGVAVDDAYISYIYAERLAGGQGLTFFDGARVEGYTNFLWVLILAAGVKAGIEPVATSQLLGVLSGVGLVLAVWWWCWRHSVAPGWLWFAPGLVAVSGPIAYWAQGGLETVTLSLLLMVGCTLWSPRSPRTLAATGLVFVGATLTHPDAAIWFCVYLVMTIFELKGREWSKPLILIGVFLLPVAVYWLWRWSYFGDLMPNTFYAKDTLSIHQLFQGAKYIYLGSLAGGVAAFALVTLGTASGLWRRPEVRLLLAEVIVWLLYVVWVGGDALPAYRFLIPLVAPSAILVQESLAALLRESRLLRFSLGCLMVSLVVIVLSLPSWIRGGVTGMGELAEINSGRVNLGRWFHENLEPTDAIAYSAAGVLPYYAKLPGIDMVGLTDRYVAHHGLIDDRAPIGHKKYAADYVLGRAPAFIVLSVVGERGQQLTDNGRVLTPSLPSNDSLLTSPDFWREYVRVRILGIDAHEVVFARRDRAGQLVARGLIQYFDIR
ncbi:MAG TPA: hypothetical protein VI876_03230 [Dehalococcoidia bacterium]|nr:hypothetical protein [Dehalococcoidia bacterium]